MNQRSADTSTDVHALWSVLVNAAVKPRRMRMAQSPEPEQIIANFYQWILLMKKDFFPDF